MNKSTTYAIHGGYLTFGLDLTPVLTSEVIYCACPTSGSLKRSSGQGATAM